MTMPTRPAPAPPRIKEQAAADNANVTLLQLHLLQKQQQRSQHNNVTVPKLTIKLPPPKDRPVLRDNNAQNNKSALDTKSNTLIQARYTPITDWNGSLFESGISSKIQKTSTNSGHNKVPPPRPPPPRCVPKTAPIPNVQQSMNILSNIFQRKKPSKRSVTSNYVTSQVYSSATCGSISVTKQQRTEKQVQQPPLINWDTDWNTSCTISNIPQNEPKEPQLISFDSPPSSPTFTQKSNSDCLSVESFSSDSNFSSPNYGSASQPESGFEDDFNSAARSRPDTTSPRDPWESIEISESPIALSAELRYGNICTAHVRNLNTINSRVHNNDDNPLCNGKSLLPPITPLHIPTIIKPKISQKPKAPKPPNVHGLQSKHIDNENGKWSSPPTPTFTLSTDISNHQGSILDVITGKIDALQLESKESNAINTSVQPYGIALYSFDGQEEGDLSFRENEKIYLLEQVNADWLKGRTRSGCEGIFPVNYIEIKIPLHKIKGGASNTNNGSLVTNVTTNAALNNSKTILKAKCLYNFPAEINGDLELKENDLVTILYRINDDWLYGELDGRQGQFPAIFLESVPSNIPTM